MAIPRDRTLTLAADGRGSVPVQGKGREGKPTFRNAFRAPSGIRLRLMVGLPSVALTIGLTGSPALAQQAAPITVVEVESTLKPSPITLTVSRAVELNVQNAGKADHNLLSDIPVSNVKVRACGHRSGRPRALRGD
jgi:hypothetical protein